MREERDTVGDDMQQMSPGLAPDMLQPKTPWPPGCPTKSLNISPTYKAHTKTIRAHQQHATAYKSKLNPQRTKNGA